MAAAALAFLAGILLLARLPELPPLALLLPLSLPLPWLVHRPRYRLPAALAAGFCYAALHAHLLLGTPLPAALEGRDLVVTGRIASLPEEEAGRRRFLLEVDGAAEDAPLPARLRLSLQGGVPPAAGERWRFTVRLKRPHGYRNPGGFDYEEWLFRQGVGATGYVRDGERLAVAPWWRLDPWRERLATAIAAALPRPAPFAGVVAALAMGGEGGIGRDQWRVFNATGINHLVSISGLHIGLVAGLLFGLVRWGWGRWPALALRLPAPLAGAAAALAGALGYAALAGFAVPTQRAVVMIAVALAALWRRRPVAPSRLLATALWAVLLLDPWAALAPGAWLSFAAVAAIVAGMGGRWRPAGWWWRWGRLQLLLAIVLAPLLVIWFGAFSPAAPLANLVAVPAVELLAVPLALAGALLLPLLPWLGGELLAASHGVLALLWPFLEWLAGQPWALWWPAAPPLPLLLPALVGAALALAPRGLPGRWLAPLLWLPLLLHDGAPPPPGAFHVTLLDVGQGLAATVRTHRHLLLYDAGPAFPGGIDSGQAVVLPYLRRVGTRQLDAMVLSHGGSDHRGGAAAVAAALPPERLLGGEPLEVAGRASEPCRTGEEWRWDGVTFRLLGPGAAAGSGNDASCVLQVEAAAGGRLLLLGDAERGAEATLVRRYGAALRSDLLVVPHHGSLTSSTPPFVAAVQPRYALFSTGYRNRFGFPKPAVTARYRQQGATLLDTAAEGAIGFTVGADGVRLSRRERVEGRRLWQRTGEEDGGRAGR